MEMIHGKSMIKHKLDSIFPNSKKKYQYFPIGKGQRKEEVWFTVIPYYIQPHWSFFGTPKTFTGIAQSYLYIY